VLYHTNWKNADSSNIEYGFYLGLFIHFLVKVMFSVKLEQTGSKSVSHWVGEIKVEVYICGSWLVYMVGLW